MSQRILVWDLPTRLFHWMLAISFVAAWLTSEKDEWLSVHTFFGYLILSLICFRLIWGVAGGHYARFKSFLYSPMAGLRYLRQLLSGGGARHVGHNPAGSQSVYLLIFLGPVVVLTGLLTQGGEEHHGAIIDVVNITTAKIFKEGHNITATLMLLLVFGHMAGVLMESWLHKENLPRSMVTGMKFAPEGTPSSRPYRMVGAMLLVAATTFGGWWFSYALHEPAEVLFGLEDGDQGVPEVAFVGPMLADDSKWREECGSCHLAFHPNLLPVRSWQKMMAEQEKHFGTDLALDADTSKVLLSFLVNNAAESSNREAAFKINRSIKAEDTPLRVTEAPYWVKKHEGIAEAVWHSVKVKSKNNCAACHLDAEAGTFEDAAMRIPY